MRVLIKHIIPYRIEIHICLVDIPFLFHFPVWHFDWNRDIGAALIISNGKTKNEGKP